MPVLARPGLFYRKLSVVLNQAKSEAFVRKQLLVGRLQQTGPSSAQNVRTLATYTGQIRGQSFFRRAFLAVWRIVRFGTLSVAVIGTGIAIGMAPMISPVTELLNPPSDQVTLSSFQPPDEESAQIDNFIKNHRLARSLRENPDFSEARPHLKIPEWQRPHNLTGGVLLGPGKITVPPLVFIEQDGKSLVSMTYLGEDLCGHPGIVHGGLLATLLDEGLARCCFPALPNKIAVTASLRVDYKNPTPAGSFVVLKARTTKVEGRKAWVEGHLETLVREGEEPLVLAEAKALFIEPRQAASLARFNPVK